VLLVAAVAVASCSEEEAETARDEVVQACSAVHRVSSAPAGAGWVGAEGEEAGHGMDPAQELHRDLVAAAAG
jgi:hypothetical protein